ncbi:MAG: ComE operon protein 3 [Xylophilus sp.]|nr:MAG: ComE operon protein 3 [Xylophilus sp.]
MPPPLRALGLPLLLPVLLWQPPRPAPGSFELTAVDVGQGAAVLVRTATHALLYDTGPRYSRDSDAGHRVLVPLLQSMGERLDTVVVSHRDEDHAGGAAAVLAQQPAAALLAAIEPGHPLWALRPGTRCEAGQRWEWDGVQFAVLRPEAGNYDRPRLPSNAMSCVLRITAGGTSALLTGDIPAAQEAAPVAGGAALAADWLLVPHHGSRHSSSEPFLRAVAPRWAVVQAGYRSRFGHPAPDVVERLRVAGAAVVASPSCGAANWSSASPGTLRCERDVASRYWQHAAAPS